MGRHLRVRYWSDTSQWILCFDSCQLTTTWMCNIRLQAPTLARKLESVTFDIDFPVVRTDGRAGGRTV